jgi:hypothetical protein
MNYDIDRGLEILERTPATLSALLSGLSEDWLHSNEGADTFSPRDVVGHLIAGEETDWVARTEFILAHGADQPFTPFDRFSFREDYKDSSVEAMLETFRKLRAENLVRIHELNVAPAQLDLEGAHPELGRVTLRQLLATWVVHDLAHIRQIARVMAKQYRDDVGPWREYLRVLDE